MNNWIGPYSKQLWNYAMNVLHNFFGLNINTNSFLLEKRQPSSPTTKEPNWLATNQLTWHGGAIRLVQYLSTFFWVSTAAAANFFLLKKEEGVGAKKDKRLHFRLLTSSTFKIILFFSSSKWKEEEIISRSWNQCDQIFLCLDTFLKPVV